MATLELHFRPTVSRFISTAATGTTNTQPAREIACFGTRGDGKTWGAFGAMIAHAQAHHQAGHGLPTHWLGAADTFRSHEEKTHRSLTAAGWKGTWKLRDGGHLAVFTVAGAELVHLHLFGVEDQAGMDRLRAECHGLWFEEPAPASVLVTSSGLQEEAWALGMTSQRLPSHAHPAIMTLNYPDEDHWTWQRFVVRQHPGSAYFRVPPGELASAAQRAEWDRALEGRPDLKRRLLEGKPGALVLGEQVAVGFNEDVHAPSPLRLTPDRTATLWIGQDGGLTPTSVIGQREGRRVKVLGALSSQHDGIKQHMQGVLLPWLSEHTPWALEDHEAIIVCYDPSMNVDGQGDTESNPLRIMRTVLPARYRPGAVKWQLRIQPVLTLLGLREGLSIDPVQARGLVRALTGGWHYATGPDGKVRKDEPVKNHPHSDYGDAFAYMVGEMAPLRPTQSMTQTKARLMTDKFDYWRNRTPAATAVRSTRTVW